jgi:hypothetical protein
MTQATTISQDSPAAGSAPGAPPASVLTNLLVTLLAPLFLSAEQGDMSRARIAAAETLSSYRAQSNPDLIAIAQIVAFGLSALGSLSLAASGDLPLSLTLRLRGNANACHRAAEQNRRALHQQPPRESRSSPPDHDETADEAAATISPHERPSESRSAPSPASASRQIRPQPESHNHDRQQHAIWAAAAANLAGEYAAHLKTLPPDQRRAVSIRAAALSSAADLLSGNMSVRSRPADLIGSIRATGA